MKDIWGFLLHIDIFIYNEELEIRQRRYRVKLN